MGNVQQATAVHVQIHEDAEYSARQVVAIVASAFFAFIGFSFGFALVATSFIGLLTLVCFSPCTVTPFVICTGLSALVFGLSQKRDRKVFFIVMGTLSLIVLLLLAAGVLTSYFTVS
jgi:hypothetical protein